MKSQLVDEKGVWTQAGLAINSLLQKLGQEKYLSIEDIKDMTGE